MSNINIFVIFKGLKKYSENGKIMRHLLMRKMMISAWNIIREEEMMNGQWWF